MNGEDEYEDIEEQVKVKLISDLTGYHPSLTKGREGTVEGSIADKLNYPYGFIEVNFSGIDVSVPVGYIVCEESDFIKNIREKLGEDKILKDKKDWELMIGDGTKKKFFFSGSLESEIKSVISHNYKKINIENVYLTEIESEHKFSKGGTIDFLGRDGRGNYLLIECKGRAGDSAIGQLLRYKTALQKEEEIEDKRIKLILITKDNTDVLIDITEKNNILLFNWEKYVHFNTSEKGEEVDKVIYKFFSYNSHEDIIIEVDVNNTEMDYIKNFVRRMNDTRYERISLLDLKNQVLETDNKLNKIIRNFYILKKEKENEIEMYIHERRNDINKEIEAMREKFKEEKKQWRASEFYKIFKMATANNLKIKNKKMKIEESLTNKQSKLK